MPVAVVYTFPKDAIAVYDRQLAAAGDTLRVQPKRRSHVCFETGETYTVVDVWESVEDFEAFGEVLARVARDDHPAAGEPKAGPLHIEIHTVHNSIP